MTNPKQFRMLAARLSAAALLLTSVGRILATVHYVDVNSNNATPPYTNWITAATNIQDAVDAAEAGDEIVVTNGVYQTGARGVYGMANRVALTKPLSVRSVNGPAMTSIVGSGSSGAEAVRCVYLTNSAVLSGFTLTNGGTQNSFEYLGFKTNAGGGVWCESLSAVVSNCVLGANGIFCRFGGGAYSGTLNNCTLIGNSAIDGGGAIHATLNNCTLIGNAAFQGGGVESCTLNNCTLTHNSANDGGAALACTLSNCIAPYEGNIHYLSLSSLNHCWTTDPLFVDTNGWANLRLQSNSPCINAGLSAFAPAGTDLDGNPRIVGGTVDIGAYEFQAPTSRISYAWLQQFNLPVDPATDTDDPDGDGVDNYHEWLSGTYPTNRFSSPAQLTIFPSSASIILTWSTNAVGFALQFTTNLGLPAVWGTNSPSPVFINGQNTVTNPIFGVQKFYRLVR